MEDGPSFKTLTTDFEGAGEEATFFGIVGLGSALIGHPASNQQQENCLTLLDRSDWVESSSSFLFV